MSIYNIGMFIKFCREDIGVTQDELASGICSVQTLSRIERGIQAPQDSTLIQIIQRLGMSGGEIILMANEKQLTFSRLKFDIRQAYIQENYEEAKKILRDNRDQISKLSPFDRQTFETIDILLKIRDKEYGESEALERLEAALKLTYPKYTKDILPSLFTYEEILLLNNIAIRYANLGNLKTAIDMLYHIKDFYDKRVCDIEEALRTEPMVLYNLSKYLGLSEKYTESIRVCEEGIKLAAETGRCSCLPQTYYNLSCGLYYRNRPGDMEASLEYMKLAYYSARSMMLKESKDKYAKVILDRYNMIIESL